MKTAIFDFNAVLKEDPRNVQALSGRGFVHLALRQQKVLSMWGFADFFFESVEQCECKVWQNLSWNCWNWEFLTVKGSGFGWVHEQPT